MDVGLPHLHALQGVPTGGQPLDVQADVAGEAAGFAQVHLFDEHVVEIEVDDATLQAHELHAGAIEMDPERAAVDLRPVGIPVVFVAVALLIAPVGIIFDVADIVGNGRVVVEKRERLAVDSGVRTVDHFGGAEGVDGEIRAAGLDRLERVLAAGQAGLAVNHAAVFRGGRLGVDGLLEDPIEENVHRAAIAAAGGEQFDLGAVEAELDKVAIDGRFVHVLAELRGAAALLVNPRAGISGVRRGVVGEVAVAGRNDIQRDDRVVRVPGVGARQREFHHASVLAEGHRFVIS